MTMRRPINGMSEVGRRPSYSLEQGIGHPPPHRSWKYPFDRMDVGDSFSVPLSELSKVRASCSYYGKRHNPKRKYSVRMHDMTERTYRCWRVE